MSVHFKTTEIEQLSDAVWLIIAVFYEEGEREREKKSSYGSFKRNTGNTGTIIIVI